MPIPLHVTVCAVEIPPPFRPHVRFSLESRIWPGAWRATASSRYNIAESTLRIRLSAEPLLFFYHLVSSRASYAKNITKFLSIVHNSTFRIERRPISRPGRIARNWYESGCKLIGNLIWLSMDLKKCRYRMRGKSSNSNGVIAMGGRGRF